MNRRMKRILAFTGLAVFLMPRILIAESETTNCAIPVPDGEVLGETFDCGRIEVPENWYAPDGRMIQISYIVLKSTNLAPFEDPVIYFQGGPGG